MLFIVLLVFIIKIVESAVEEVVLNNQIGLSKELMEHENEVLQSDGLICPTEPHGLPLFSYKCKTDEDCRIFGEQCCQEGRWKICRHGVYKKQKEEPKHKPLLPGIPRFCPSKEAIIEILPVQNCTKDVDCGSRICCPDGKISYCRTAVMKWDSALSPRLIKTFRNIVSYLQCTSPPPPILDFFPKPCKNTLDCFPNLCCQEQGKKVCRPPKRSILTLLAALT